ncbi:IS1096 element passenger TnpR family protein [Halomonas sp.]|uniref:IS1096 element passenger TnpR family protein n=1 Tax=Halomonas sp. TaxID=1486246 RepID=UPI003D0FC9E9
MACPPEDIGGTGGYAALKAAAAGEKDAYGQELLEAIGGQFDPEALDEDEIALMLEPFQAGFRRLGSVPG